MKDKKAMLEKIVGKSNVSDDQSVLDQYSTDVSFSKPLSPRFVVKVENAGQVEELVKWANETLTPLVPVSSGAPAF